jgi:HK97 family phage prohead protease
MRYKNFVSSEKSFNDDEMTITHYISTSTPDRYGEIVNPFGMDDTNFRKNPVVLFGHNSRNLVIGKNISLVADEYGVKAITKFADTDTGRDLYKLNRDGFLNAWSIGFLPVGEITKKYDDKTKETYSYIEKWELLEYSSVPVPANPDAINLLYKSIKSEEVFKEILLGNELNDTKTEIENLKSKIEELEDSISKKLIKILKLIK